MDRELQQFQHLKIDLEKIKKATNNFDDEKNYIGFGGFGKVYKGELSHPAGGGMVAIKRLDHTQDQDQGDAEFLKEIVALSRYKHENLISLLGFCYQEKEAILVYQLASRGSLDEYLGSRVLTWTLRLKICLGAAKGLRHLHDPRGTHQRLIHCDVKSGNILLDDHWNAMVADFGFSTTGPANELQSAVINLAAGTRGYCDPYYVITSTLTKESDVYSFGVVLVEVFCGSLCHSISNGSVQYNLVPAWIKSYEENKLNDIVFKDPAIQPLEQFVLQIFSDIAYQCLNESRKDRPEMAVVVTELETALKIHEVLQNQNRNGQGVLLNEDKTWFSINKKGEHCEMISMAECLDPNVSAPDSYRNNSRFPAGTYRTNDAKFKTVVLTQFLSPGITYTVNFVFKFTYEEEDRNYEPVSIIYKLQGEEETSVSYLAYKREDGWWMVELYQFTCDQRFNLLRILFEDYGFRRKHLEGIEFRPLEKVEPKEDENQPISDLDSDADWEENLPIDYEDIMKRSKNSLQWETKKEAYSLMREGFLVNDDDQEDNIWFCLDKNGKKCHMVAPRKIIDQTWAGSVSLQLEQSRFGEAFQFSNSIFGIEYEVHPQLVSSQTTYAIYLVYKLSEDHSGFEVPMRVYNKEYRRDGGKDCLYICLVDPQTPIIKPKADQNTHNPAASKLIKECLPQQRNDGWMEVKLHEIRSVTTIMNPIRLELATLCDSTVLKGMKFRGLIVEGFEFRPV